MSRKTKKKHLRPSVAMAQPVRDIANDGLVQAAVENVALPVEGVAEELPTLSELELQARAYRKAGDREGMLKLGRLAPFEIKVAPGENVAAWLALQRVRGLAGAEELSAHERYYKSEDQAALHEALTALGEYTPDLHLTDELELFVRSRGYGPKGCLQGFPWMLKACEARPWDLHGLEQLRGCILRMLDDSEWHDDEECLSPEEHEQVRGMELDRVLRDAFERTAAIENLAFDDRMLLTAMRADIDMRFAEPWDGEQVLRWARRLEPEGLLTAASYSDSGNSALTPTSWFFLWELQNTTTEAALERLLAKHAAGFNDRRCESLRLLGETLLRPQNGDEPLLAALRLLALEVEERNELYGHSLAVNTPEGINYYPIAWDNFFVPNVDESLIRLLETAGCNHPRFDALLKLPSIWERSAQYLALDEDNESALEYDRSPGLEWLCKELPLVQFHAASVLPTAAVRLRRHLEMVLDWARSDVEPPVSQPWADLSDAQLNAAQRAEIHAILESIYPFMPRMTGSVSEFFAELLDPTFRELVDQVSDAGRPQVLRVARLFDAELETSNQCHHLAWLAHSSGELVEAVDWYLRVLRSESAHRAWAIKNLNGVLGKLKAVDDVEAAIALIQEDAFQPDQEPNRAAVLATARARLSTLEQQDQYARTAVNRWPKLTQPARQILSVLAQIKRYGSFTELGSYAGMDAIWAERHYDKLVETGMLQFSETGYFVNPYIAPLLARENQHSVVGRIVRASGTSAVKQVFNSQREFNIYQVLVQLCPNHLVFPNCGLQSFMSYERMKELVESDDFGYYLRASVDVLVVSSTTHLPLLAIEVDSVWHDTERQTVNDGKKDRLFAAAGVPFLRLRPVGNPSEAVIRGQVAEHLNDLVRTLRQELPGYDQAKTLLLDLAKE